MDRGLLESMLAEGLSLAEIGRRAGRHEATVSYWLRKYGLAAAHHDRHASRGAPDRSQLARLVRSGMSVAGIAREVGRSSATIRHWLTEFGLRTQWQERRDALAAGERRMMLVCARHGSAEFSALAGGGFRCVRCRSEAVSRRRRKVKRLLVEEAGGRCAVCGYDRCMAALEFHHVDPADKRFELSRRGVTRSLEAARAEAAKCVLLCGNCHAEVEAGLLDPGRCLGVP